MPRIPEGGSGGRITPKPKTPLTPLIRPTTYPYQPYSREAYTWPRLNEVTIQALVRAEEAASKLHGYNPAGYGPAPGGGPGPLPATPPAPPSLKPLWEVKWKPATYGVPGGTKPAWWVNLQPVDPKDAERPDVQYLMMLNSTLPYLSPEDQRNAAAQIYTTAADAFSAYKPEKISAIAPINLETQLTSPVAQAAGTPVIDEAYFGSSQRASEALQALSNMREATVQGNRWKLGPGYTWLQSLLGAMGATRDLSPNNGQRLTATQTLQMLGALDPLLAQGQSQEIGPVANIGRLLSQPFFSGGNIFGSKQPNPLLGF